MNPHRAISYREGGRRDEGGGKRRGGREGGKREGRGEGGLYTHLGSRSGESGS